MGEVLERDVEVVPALAVGQPGLELAGLDVHDIGGQRTCIASEERVVERAVAPEEAGQVQPDEEARQRVEEELLWLLEAAPAEHDPERQRVLEVARDQHRRQLLGVPPAPLAHDGNRLDGGHARALEVAEQPVLALCDLVRQLLEGVVRAAELDKADDVTADAALEVDQVGGGPGLELLVPRQREEARVGRAADQPVGGGGQTAARTSAESACSSSARLSSVS